MISTTYRHKIVSTSYKSITSHKMVKQNKFEHIHEHNNSFVRTLAWDLK